MPVNRTPPSNKIIEKNRDRNQQGSSTFHYQTTSPIIPPSIILTSPLFPAASDLNYLVDEEEDDDDDEDDDDEEYEDPKDSDYIDNTVTVRPPPFNESIKSVNSCSSACTANLKGKDTATPNPQPTDESPRKRKPFRSKPNPLDDSPTKKSRTRQVPELDTINLLKEQIAALTNQVSNLQRRRSNSASVLPISRSVSRASSHVNDPTPTHFPTRLPSRSSHYSNRSHSRFSSIQIDDISTVHQPLAIPKFLEPPQHLSIIGNPNPFTQFNPLNTSTGISTSPNIIAQYWS